MVCLPSPRLSIQPTSGQSLRLHCRPSITPRHHLSLHSKTCIASTSESNEVAGSAPKADNSPAQGRVLKEWNSYGTPVIESSENFDGPENQKDFWEEERFQGLGTVLEKWFFPVIIALSVLCGGIASKLYNDGATQFLVTPTNEEQGAFIIDATEVPQ